MWKFSTVFINQIYLMLFSFQISCKANVIMKSNDIFKEYETALEKVKHFFYLI